MKTLNALDAKNRFGELSEMVQREPVQITKRGRPSWVAISVHDFEAYQSLDRKMRQDSLDALTAVQDSLATAGFTDEEKRDLIGHDE